MSIIFSHPYSDFTGHIGAFNISTGPVIVSKDGNKVLLHISSSTNKYQFIGGRLDDSLSFRENALMRAREVVGDNTITLTADDPTILIDTIVRDEKEEKILLIHYRAHIENENTVGLAQWFTLSEIQGLHNDGNTSSPNILIASRLFLP